MTARQLIVWWNNLFPFDRTYRNKYKIGFNSPEHRSLNPFDMKLDLLEDAFFDEHSATIKLREFEKIELAKGSWLKYRESVTKEESDNIFDKFHFSEDIPVKVVDDA